MENRYVRLEDWDGNKYYFDKKGGSGGGIGTEIVDSARIETDRSKIDTAKYYSEGTIVTDEQTSSGKAVLTDYSEDIGVGSRILFRGRFDNIPFGNVSINIRLRPIFNDQTWFFEEKSSIDSIILFYALLCYYDNETNTRYPIIGTSFDKFMIASPVTISALKVFPIVPTMNNILLNQSNLKKLYEKYPGVFANTHAYGEISIVMPYGTSKVVKNGSLELHITRENNGTGADYSKAAFNNLLQSILIDNVSVSKASGSIVSAPYQVWSSVRDD